MGRPRDTRPFKARSDPRRLQPGKEGMRSLTEPSSPLLCCFTCSLVDDGATHRRLMKARGQVDYSDPLRQQPMWQGSRHFSPRRCGASWEPPAAVRRPECVRRMRSKRRSATSRPGGSRWVRSDGWVGVGVVWKSLNGVTDGETEALGEEQALGSFLRCPSAWSLCSAAFSSQSGN